MEPSKTDLNKISVPGDANNDGGGLGRVSNPKDLLGDGRIPLWLLSSVAKIQWALAQFAGLLKYGAWNWRVAGVRASTYISAMERHIEGYKSGEEFDPVDGTHHLGNIMACAALLLDAEAAGKLTDDRPPRVNHRPAIAEGEALMARLREQYKDRKPRHYTIEDSKDHNGLFDGKVLPLGGVAVETDYPSRWVMQARENYEWVTAGFYTREDVHKRLVSKPLRRFEP